MIAALLASFIVVVLAVAVFDALVKVYEQWLVRRGWKREWTDEEHDLLIWRGSVWKGEK